MKLKPGDVVGHVWIIALCGEFLQKNKSGNAEVLGRDASGSYRVFNLPLRNPYKIGVI